MFRFNISFFSALLLINHLSAQTIARATTQDLSPADARLQKETSEVEGFARNLSSLKSAYSAKEAGQIIAYEAQLLRGMRSETDQMIESAQGEQPENARSKARLEKMASILAAFEAHSFDTAKPDLAARDFAKLDDFLQIMQDVLTELKKTSQ